MPHPTTKNENGEVEMSCKFLSPLVFNFNIWTTLDCAWKHRFASQCLSIVHDQAFGARPPNYKLVRELDKKVRNWYIPPSLQVPGFGSHRGYSTTAASVAADQPTVQLTMQRSIVFAIREISRSLPCTSSDIMLIFFSGIFSSLLHAQRLFCSSATG